MTEIGIGRLIKGKQAAAGFFGVESGLTPCSAGWDEAVLDMRVGEQATLDITR